MARSVRIVPGDGCYRVWFYETDGSLVHDDMVFYIMFDPNGHYMHECTEKWMRGEEPDFDSKSVWYRPWDKIVSAGDTGIQRRLR